MEDKKMLMDDELVKVTGGGLEYYWDGKTQTGYVLSTKSATKYYFNADHYYDVTRAVNSSDGNGKTDQEDLADMMQWFYKVE